MYILISEYIYIYIHIYIYMHLFIHTYVTYVITLHICGRIVGEWNWVNSIEFWCHVIFLRNEPLTHKVDDSWICFLSVGLQIDRLTRHFFSVCLMPADPSDFVRHPRLAVQEVSQCVGFGEQEGQAKKSTVARLVETCHVGLSCIGFVRELNVFFFSFVQDLFINSKAQQFSIFVPSFPDAPWNIYLYLPKKHPPTNSSVL